MRHPIPHMHKTRTGWSYRPPWMAACKPPKVITTPKPRVEDSVRTIARLKKIRGDERAQAQVGKAAGDFYLAATDGARALLLPRDGKERIPMPDEFGQLPPNRIMLTDPEIFIIIKRALVIADIDSHAIGLKISKWFLNVEAKESYTGDSFLGTVNLPTHGCPQETIGVNGGYMLDALGVWPLYFHWSDPTCMVVLRPEDDSWRYLLMPMKL